MVKFHWKLLHLSVWNLISILKFVQFKHSLEFLPSYTPGSNNFSFTAYDFLDIFVWKCIYKGIYNWLQGMCGNLVYGFTVQKYEVKREWIVHICPQMRKFFWAEEIWFSQLKIFDAILSAILEKSCSILHWCWSKMLQGW